ncbi:geraniol dehydrogenase [Sulfitobacter sp. EhC04]|uniref:NAD(P)-dependent alcohol dehydrogenase n=1 Tax=Sulfitobacter sp. EhC04 TaxID=1849168 RepID=UPI0007F39D49|nr:NAD(P)-dependent alcohol dehydrogenase [Sulfitobacter sp. EhC04]OAN67636.1 geraniol dehydrogenase [Sulfitobacter sp. EhC04]
MKIKAAVARGPEQDLVIQDLTLDGPREDEILVKVVATGVCHTDLVVLAGHLPTPMPVVLGHEGAGIVQEVGAKVTKVKPGDHVVMTFNTCGTCPSCRDDAMAYCYEFFPRNFFATRADGSVALADNAGNVHSNFFGQSSFASHALCHARNVIKVDPEADLELLGPLACGIQTGAGTVMNALKVAAGKSFVVFGAGSVGLSAVMAAVVQGATTIIAVDMHDARLTLAKELGATHTIKGDAKDIVQQIIDITGGGVDYAMDTTAIGSVIRNASDALGPRGTLAIVGAPAPGAEINLDNTHMMSAGRKLIGVVEGESDGDTFIPKLVALWKGGKFPFDKLVTFYDFDQINQAIHDSHTGTSIKPILRMA